MKLFANGCSFTWGGALFPNLYDDQGCLLEFDNTSAINQERLSVVWPARLGELLAAEQVINLGMGCGSNDRIVRTTIDYFTNLIVLDQFTSDWTAIIQWTQPMRYEYWDEHTRTWALVIPSCVNVGQRLVEPDVQSRLEQYRNDTYRYLNDYTVAQKYFSQVVGLASFFEKNNINYWFVNLYGEQSQQLTENQCKYLDQRVQWLNTTPWHGIDQMFRDKCASMHPSQKGHEQIAQAMYYKIKDSL